MRRGLIQSSRPTRTPLSVTMSDAQEDPVPSEALAVSEGGVLSDWLSAALFRGSYSFSGSKVRAPPNART